MEKENEIVILEYSVLTEEEENKKREMVKTEVYHETYY